MINTIPNNENLTQTTENVTINKRTKTSAPSGQSQRPQKKPKKRTRTPLSQQRVLADVRVPDGYVGRWVNDIKDRIYKFTNAGYQFVKKADNRIEIVEPTKRMQDSSIDNTLITQQVGNGVKAYFMIQRKEWYRENQQGYLDEANAIEDSMLRKPKVSGFYGEASIGGKSVTNIPVDEKVEKVIEDKVEKRVNEILTRKGYE